MAHLLPEVARQGNRGPWAGAGAIAGALGGFIVSLVTQAPPDCGAADFRVVAEGIAYVCQDAMSSTLPQRLADMHTVSWLLILGPALLVAAVAASLAGEKES
jgi:hypothetical protein